MNGLLAITCDSWTPPLLEKRLLDLLFAICASYEVKGIGPVQAGTGVKPDEGQQAFAEK
jgi:hypothetical protein